MRHKLLACVLMGAIVIVLSACSDEPADNVYVNVPELPAPSVTVEAGEPDRIDVQPATPNVTVEEGDTFVDVHPEQRPARLCVETIGPDGHHLPASVTLDGMPMTVDCTPVKLEDDHRVVGGAVDGFVTPEEVVILRGSMAMGSDTLVRLVYRYDAADVCLMSVDQFNNRVHAEFLVGFDVVATGMYCGTHAADDLIIINPLVGFDQPDQREFRVGDLTESLTLVTFFRPNGAEVCLSVRNVSGEELPSTFFVDGLALHGKCVSFNTLASHVLLPRSSDPQQFGYPALRGPGERYILPGAVAVGERIEIVWELLSWTPSTQWTCVQTLPPGGEIIVNGLSWGWPSAIDRSVCFPLEHGWVHEISFGSLSGHEDAPPVVVDLTAGQTYPRTTRYVLGLYDPQLSAAVCTKALQEVGDRWESLEAPITINDEEVSYVHDTIGCKAVDPEEETRVWFGESPLLERVVIPEPRVFAPGELTLGQVEYVTPVYSYSVPPERITRAHIYVVGPTGHRIEVNYDRTAHNLSDEESGIANNGEISFWLDAYSEDAWTEFWFQQDVRSLTPSFERFRIDHGDPAASGGRLNQEAERWEWFFEYIAEEPVGLACLRAFDNNDLLIDSNTVFWGTTFDTVRGRVHDEEVDVVCQYLSVDEPHTINTAILDEHQTIRSIVIPAGTLPDGGMDFFEVQYVAQPFEADLCITIHGAQGEVVVNEHPIGWAPYVGGTICPSIRRDEPTTVSFNAVSGFRTPGDIIVEPNTFDHSYEVEVVYEPE